MTRLANAQRRRRSLRVPADLSHPFFYVECLACGSIVPMVLGPGGHPILPSKWGTVWAEKDDGSKVGDDYYASPSCIRRAMARAASLARTTKAKCVVEEA